LFASSAAQRLRRRVLPRVAADTPAPEPLPVMLVIDGDDYLIAADLEVDVPEFEHHPDWVASQG
jgi:hypothetical protein